MQFTISGTCSVSETGNLGGDAVITLYDIRLTLTRFSLTQLTRCQTSLNKIQLHVLVDVKQGSMPMEAFYNQKTMTQRYTSLT